MTPAAKTQAVETLAVKPSTAKTAFRLSVLLLAASGLGACSAASRLAEVGSAPKMTQVSSPTDRPDYRPISLPMPAPTLGERHPNSLWRPGARAFLKDQRAGQVGDLLTVNIKIEDKAQLQNETSRARDNSETAGLPKFLGFESKLSKILPSAVDPSSLVDASSASGSKGTGAVNRNETINLKVAALITQVMPNGNLVIAGRQEVRVNYELRELNIAGVIRPADITADNTISYEKIAEARISYGGRGQITDVQQPRYGQQIFDIIFPF